MNQMAILLPVLALAGWTMTVLVLIPFRVFKSVLAGQAKLDDFKLGASPPDAASSADIPNRNFMNLLEVPVLFYVLCVILHVSQGADVTAVGLAWGYVGLRMLHSLIHLTYNNVLHRGAAYAASNLVLVIILFKTFLEISK